MTPTTTAATITTAPISLAEANFGHLVGKLVYIKAADFVQSVLLEHQQRYKLDKAKYPTCGLETTVMAYDPKVKDLRTVPLRYDTVTYKFGEFLGLVVEVRPMADYLHPDDTKRYYACTLQEATALVLRDEHFILVAAYLLSPFSEPTPTPETTNMP